jgi:tetratricopeptide (TPR) repeat protein
MKNPGIRLDQGLSRFGKQAGIAALIGLPAISLLLIVTEAGFQDRVTAWRNQTFSALEAPYRYPFYDSLAAGDRNPTARLQQEMAVYQEQMQRYPDRALGQASLATAYFKMARLTGEGSWYLLAEQTAQQSLGKLAVDNTEALSVLARVTEARHDFDGALRLAQQLPPQEALPIRVSANLALGHLSEASQASEALVDQTLSQSAFTLQALVQTAQGKDREALQSFDYALEVEEVGELSNSARTRTLLGRFYYERGELQKANDLYKEALQILPNDRQALLNQGQLALRQDQPQVAEQIYQQLAGLTSGGASTVFEPLILRGRAQVAVQQGKQTEAEALWAEAETLLRQSFVGDANNASSDSSSNSFDHRRDLARLLLERGRAEDIPEAVRLMAAEVELRRDAGTLGTYAWALSATQRWGAAQAVTKWALATGIRDAGLFDQAATIEQALGNPSQAASYRQQAEAIDSQFNGRARQVMYLGAGLGS